MKGEEKNESRAVLALSLRLWISGQFAKYVARKIASLFSVIHKSYFWKENGAVLEPEPEKLSTMENRLHEIESNLKTKLEVDFIS